jgi:hypothetical protein
MAGFIGGEEDYGHETIYVESLALVGDGCASVEVPVCTTECLFFKLEMLDGNEGA